MENNVIPLQFLIKNNLTSIKKVILFISFLNSILVSKFFDGSNNNPSINFLDFSNFKFSVFNLKFSVFNLKFSSFNKTILFCKIVNS